jgi:hypothetical protein
MRVSNGDQVNREGPAKAAREGLAIVAGIIRTMTGAGGGLD